jgi:hypothetical protein
MMQFTKDQLLQLVGGFALLGVNAGLEKQGLGIDAGLLQQQPEAIVFCRQHDFLRGPRRWLCAVKRPVRRQ